MTELLPRVAAALVVACASACTHAQPSSQVQQASGDYDGWDDVVWQNLNAGAGGAIQDITLDPNLPGRLYLSSDMEGHYRSDDYGKSWHYIGSDVASSYVNTAVAHATNPDRLFVGTDASLEVSDNAGRSHRRIDLPDWKMDSIGVIGVTPLDANLVIALPGEGHRWSDSHGYKKQLVADGLYPGNFGERDFYLSRDGGDNWERVRYAEGEGRRDGFSVDVHPTDADTFVLGTATGVFVTRDGGETFKHIAAPKDAGDCVGATLGPAGDWLYATYTVPHGSNSAAVTTGRDGSVGGEGVTHIFATRLDGSVSWTDLNQSGGGLPDELQQIDKLILMKPTLDAVRSTTDRHELLASFWRPQQGLWRLVVDLSGDTPSADWQRVMWYDFEEGVDRSNESFDLGWEKWGVMSHNVIVAPKAWGEAGGHVFATSSQTLHVTDPSQDPQGSDWQPRYTRLVRQVPMKNAPGGGDSVPFYRTRGQNSEFVFDGAAWGEYVINSVADNCVHESFDGGFSWTNDLKPPPRISSRSNASNVLPPHGATPPIVLAHVAVGWGSDAETGELWAKPLETMGVEDRWVKIGGSEDYLAGLPHLLYNQIVADPHDPKAAYIGTFGRGVWRVDDVPAMIEAVRAGTPLPKATPMTIYFDGPTPTHIPSEGNSLRVDPLKADVVWCLDHIGRRIWRGEADDAAKGNWRWDIVADTPDAEYDGRRQLAVVAAGDTRLIFTGGTGDRPPLVGSNDDGKTFKTLVTYDDVASLRDRPAWLEEGQRLEFRGLDAWPRDDGSVDVFFSYPSTHADGRRADGTFAATVDASLKVTNVRDMTADMPWPYPVRSKVIDRDGPGDVFEPELYMMTRGNGLWRRSIATDGE